MPADISNALASIGPNKTSVLARVVMSGRNRPQQWAEPPGRC